ncbi:uncharacterized protein LOC120776125 isoform X1 [Bactrocera tryoni]|uniref:uncharacterized protein LOC120776125 isoform X1 n=1 Tax=Bactrocera tryoni TaxID=59916 RepID=UPI001A99A419|nr:uncharacterized protein LOC120776125 isoform X1 [Bactrocera tryoni]
MPQSIVQSGDEDVFRTLKRKRKSEGCLEHTADVTTDRNTCFTNSAFSSTPKKVVLRRRAQTPLTDVVLQDPCMEVKSISDIIKGPVEKTNSTKIGGDVLSQNPYEVQRKPPKKKKRESEIVEACFENPALNLELPEKQFNPYEVLRDVPAQLTNVAEGNCFVNAALNLRTQDVTATRNPFEIQRCQSVATTTSSDGVENTGMEVGQVVPTDLKISLPFKPTVGCRIDFTNIPIEELTPSKLLADKLVFSPVLMLPKRSLDSASEDSSMDIGKELDRYQLELENSINEAKMRKAIGPCTKSTLNVNIEQKITFNQRLAEIAEEDEENDFNKEDVEKTNTLHECTIQSHIELTGKIQTEQVERESCTVEELKNEDVAYASDSDEDEIDFKAPALFVRAYQRAATTQSKESLHSNGSNDSTDHKKPLNVRNLIRKSLRKLMHPSKHDDLFKTNSDENEILNIEMGGKDKQHASAYKIIRNGLRRKTTIKPLNTARETPTAKAEISIMDTSERRMKLTAMISTNTEGERKHTLRNSLRRSTREMGQHLMKTVFHKNHEAYELSK